MACSAAPGGGGASNGNYQQNLSDQIVNSALRYRAQAPLIDKLLKEIGLPTSSMRQFTSGDLRSVAGPWQGTAGDDTPLDASRRQNGPS